MPKVVLPLDKINPSDQDEVGENFAYLGNINSLGESLPQGSIVTFLGFEKTLEPHWRQLAEILKDVKFTAVTGAFLENLKTLTHQRLFLPEEVAAGLRSQVEDLKPPFEIKSLVKIPSGEEFVGEPLLAESKKDLEPLLKWAFLSWLDKEFLKKVADPKVLTKTLVAVAIIQKLQPDRQGSALIYPPKKNKIEIMASQTDTKEGKQDKIIVETNTLTVRDHQSKASKKVLTGQQILRIAKVLKFLQSQLLASLQASFEIVGEKLYFTNLTAAEEPQNFLSTPTPINLPLIGTLKPLFPGLSTGVVKHINKLSDFRKIRAGDIALVSSFSKGNFRSLKKASGIIVRKGAHFQKSHRQLIDSLGVSMAIGDLNTYIDGVVTLDGRTGRLYKGSFFPLVSKILQPKAPQIKLPEKPSIATKIFVTSADSNNLLKSGLEDVDGIGPIHLEIVLTKDGYHPQKLLEKDKEKTFSALVKQMEELCKKALGKPVIYQLLDFKTNALSHLKGGAALENKEINPTLGLRGTRRSLENLDFLKGELKIIKDLRNSHNYKTLWLSLPFVRDVSEVLEIKKHLSTAGLHRSASFKVLVSVAVPANVFALKEFLEAGVDGFLIDYWELANLTYGSDFTYQELIKLTDPSLEDLVSQVVTFASKNGLFSGIYNLPPETENNILKKVVTWGIKSVSIGPDLVGPLAKSLSKAEQELVA